MKVRKEKLRAARLRPDQVDAVERLIHVVPELDWSSAIRQGLDLLIEKLSAELMGEHPPVFESIAMALSREAKATPSVVERRLAKTPARSNEVPAPSEPKS